MDEKIKIYVGVSGGVDSSVTLALLKKQNFDVTGVFLKVWNPDFLPCNWREERRSAMRVCSQLDVPFKTIDCEKEYKEKIVDYMISEYKKGRTPNPDVFCNKYIKFGIFLEKAKEQGSSFVATGHYARKLKIKSYKVKSKEKDEYQLLEAVDKEKDQSYFLSNLSQEQLSKAMFPIGHLKKSEVRELARKYGLETAEKKDSQGLCFVGKVDMKDFLSHFIETKKGKVLNEDGEVIGEHNGAIFYTIGERKGFTIKNQTEKSSRLFVIDKDIENNTITVGKKVESEKLNLSTDKVGVKSNPKSKSIKILIGQENKEFVIKDVNWIGGEDPDFSKKYTVCFRYHQEKQICKIEKINEKETKVLCDNNQFGVASGQIAVFYDEEVCLGGGVIE